MNLHCSLSKNQLGLVADIFLLVTGTIFCKLEWKVNSALKFDVLSLIWFDVVSGVPGCRWSGFKIMQKQENGGNTERLGTEVHCNAN